MNVQLTRIVVHLIERHAECGVSIQSPARQVVACAVVRTGHARADQARDVLADLGAELGTLLVRRALDVLDAPADSIQAYGKAALMGMRVPLEYGAALLHRRLGHAVRSALPGATTIMPSVAKRGAPGASIDIPLHGVADMWNLALFDTVSLALPDSPAPDEVLVAVALADSGRPLASSADF